MNGIYLTATPLRDMVLGLLCIGLILVVWTVVKAAMAFVWWGGDW